ncbi:Spa2p KNAG_0I03010 [Huiozyma naganishii CBS 8797]|uniref:GIT Spa2 homology (SHD) domain-containing protein n=1 Tax=Huiozyma naganishii (strain ATCC MYA-139 / BCRC 22969 / CBS 8797 / KCTC 17520 / NBRC 10181 / NCYC 3082 / Yp74L-3) TaxID=1071383 RepID=J7RB33_HUIN7|nr:hypothetical protein KNAG_0I03010 [Kazachstania naganishii CBS 8797]CCK72085.1 hypothetical protein KNAG_0I03010 [Kazachstania naganishii CBS 8797]
MNSVKFTTEHSRDVYQYYVKLKTYFDITGLDLQDRASSARAKKARAKLLKLSSLQFYELSTDVTDELQRRINEDQNKPEYLLPKTSFHVKRNQARQKLSNLSQLRFNDLVDDILFEIQRREYHLPSSVQNDEADQREEHSNNANLPSGQNGATGVAYDIDNIMSPKVGDPSFLAPSTPTAAHPPVILAGNRNSDEPESPSFNLDTLKDINDEKHTAGFNAGPVMGDSTESPQLKSSPIIPRINVSESDAGTETDTGTMGSLPPATSTIQQSVIIPQKASIDWSSSDESDNEADAPKHGEVNKGAVSKETTNYELPSDDTRKSGQKDSPPQETARDIPLPDATGLTSQKLSSSSPDDHPVEMTQKSTRVPDLAFADDSSLNIPYQDSGFVGDDDSPLKAKTESNSASKTKLKSPTDADLGLQLQVPAPPPVDTVERNDVPVSLAKDTKLSQPGHDESISHLQKELLKLNTQIGDLSIENENLKQKLSESEFKLRMKKNGKTTKNYETFFEVETLLNEKSVQKHISKNGIIPIDFVTKLHNLITELFVSLNTGHNNEENENKNKNKIPQHKGFGEFLFRLVAQISGLVSSIIDLVKLIKDCSDLCTLLRSSMSHAINAIRYYSLYESLLPKVIVFASISEVAFAVCQIIQTAKITSVPGLDLVQEKNKPSPNAAKSKVEAEVRNIPGTPVLVDREELASTFSEPTAQREPKPTDSPVKPLRIIEKVINSPVLKPQGPRSTMRKPSGSGLVSLMLDNKRVSSPSLKVSSNQSSEKNLSNLSGQSISAKDDVEAPVKDKNEFDKSGATSPTLSDLNLLKEPSSSIDSVTEQEMGKAKETSAASASENTPAEKPEDSNRLTKESPKSNVTALSLTEPSGPAKNVADKLFDKLNSISPDREIRSNFSDDSDDEKLDILALKKSMGQDYTTKEESGPVDSVPKMKPIKINKLESSSLRRVDVSNGGGAKGLGITMNSETKKQPTKRQDEPIVRKQDEAAPQETPTVRVESKTNPASHPNGQENLNLSPVIKQENEDDLNISHHSSEASDNDDSYQFAPLEKREKVDEPRTSIKEESPKIGLIAGNANDKENSSGEEYTDDTDSEEDEEEVDFDVDAFDIENPDNTLSELLLYLEHQTVEVISTIQSLLSSIKEPKSTKGSLRKESNAINQVIGQMADATSVSMNQSRNANLKKHGGWVVQSLEDCARRMTILCQLSKDGVFQEESSDNDYADKNFKQRLAGIAFDVAKCTKELVKSVEEASLKEEIDFLNSKLE